MKRNGNLYPHVTSFANLLLAACKARRGKRWRPDVLRFHFDQERRLLDLRGELTARTYRPGAYRSFWIQDPKRRLISAAPYRDRVVHHALCQVIEPIFEKGYIHDSYANRVGKGTHAALQRCTAFARRRRFALKCDIEKYFPSIDHEILLRMIERKIKCRDTLWLIERIVANSNDQEETNRYFPGDTLFTPFERRKGIPIGNLTSQFLANVYLGGLDHFIKQELHRREYVRFCDDFVIFGDDAGELNDLIPALQGYLNGLRLRMHPTKCQVIPVHCGVPFLGWQVFPNHRRLRRSTGVRMQRNLRRLSCAYGRGEVTWARVSASVMSWIGHLKHGDTWGLRRKLLGSVVFRVEQG